MPTPLICRDRYESSDFAAKLLKVPASELDEDVRISNPALALTRKQSREEFQREVALLFQLRHPQVAQFVGVSYAADGSLILLRYLIQPSC